ncbi:DUF2971 domain-containing protein [Treponema denticola]|nr:DUF2971 domain-containing protein [Treponema denticola]
MLCGHPHWGTEKKMSKIFYKFKNINQYTIDSIKNKYFYFSTPQQLNDPVDCRTPFCYDATNSEILKWIKHAKKMGRLIGENPSTFPFNTVDKVKKSIASTGILKRIFENAENNSANKFHLLSLTDDFNNAKMWNHTDYCNNFSGICIGYLSEQVQQQNFGSYFIKVKGTVSTRTPYFLKYNSDYYFVLKKVEYDNDRLHCYNPFKEQYDKNYMLNLNSESFNSQNIKYNLFHKTNNWKYENEYRGFYYCIEDDDSKVYYDENIIESISFGSNASKPDINTIINCIKMNYNNFDKIKFYTVVQINNTIIRTEMKIT